MNSFLQFKPHNYDVVMVMVNCFGKWMKFLSIVKGKVCHMAQTIVDLFYKNWIITYAMVLEDIVNDQDL